MNVVFIRVTIERGQKRVVVTNGNILEYLKASATIYTEAMAFIRFGFGDVVAPVVIPVLSPPVTVRISRRSLGIEFQILINGNLEPQPH